ncbi:PAS domain S-box protein [Desulfobacterota bacterium M19]
MVFNNIRRLIGTSSLRYKIISLILIVAAGVGILFFALIAPLITRALHEQLVERGYLLARTVAADSANDVLTDNRVALNLFLHRLKVGENDLRYVFIVNARGRVIAHSFRGSFPADLLKNLGSLSSSATFISRLYNYDDDEIQDIAVPVINSGIATVHAGISTAAIQSDIKDIKLRLMLIIFIVSITGIALAYFLSRFITRPLEELSAYAGEIGAGNLNVPPLNIRGDEVGALASNINAMRLSLKDDIAERQETEISLREAKTALENIFNSANPICIVSLEGEILKGNEAYYHHWPHSCRKCHEIRPAAACGTETCPLLKIKKGALSVEYEVVLPCAGGGEITFIVTGRPYYDIHGKLSGIVETFQDITERRRMQAILDGERERLAVTLRSIGDGVITTDPEGRIMVLNKIAEQMTGWTMDEAAGRSLEEVFRIIDEHERLPLESPAAQVLRSGKIVDLANGTVLLSKDGRELNIADSGAPIHDSRSEVIGVVLVFRDITLEKKIAQESRRMEKLEAIGVLAGGIAHDFNNILAAIMGNVSLALMLTDRADKRHHLLSQVEKASERARNLVQQLLTFSRGGDPFKTLSTISDIIRESAEFVLRGSNVKSEFDFAPDLWAVEVDKGQIGQVVQNLVINAVQAMPDGGNIRLSCDNFSLKDSEEIPFAEYANSKRYLRIIIRDDGCGMPSEVSSRIFDPYFTTKEKGNGLGMAVTHSVIRKHGGHILVDSRPGVGTTFTIYLPASMKAVAAVEKDAPSMLDIVGTGRGLVLIMDDDELVRDIAENMLSAAGFETLNAPDGTAALEIYKQAAASDKPIDVLLMDLTIPGGMGGEQTAAEVLKFDPEAVIIVSSGYSNDHVMANYRDYGFKAAVVKPYNMQELVSTVGRLMMDKDK